MSNLNNEFNNSMEKLHYQTSSKGTDNSTNEHVKKGEVEDREQKIISQVDPESRVEVLKEGLKSRHVQLIALGGCIGTGMFIGSGSILANCGPGSLLIGYIIMSVVLWDIMVCLGEMATYIPLPGTSAYSFVDRYFDSSLGFAAGWNYFYAFSIIIPAEITAAGIIIEYWTDSVNSAVWITIFLLVITILNFLPVSFYGETEFWFASIKIICIIMLLIVGLVIICGGAPDHDAKGFRYWNNPGAFVEHLTGGSTGRFLGVWTAIIKAGFAFVVTPELVVATSGETECPRRNLPKAANRFIYRLAFFYVGAAIIIGTITSSTDNQLLDAIAAGTSTAAASPFVIGIQNAGIHVLNHIVNACILTSAWSAGNSFVYAASRTAYSLAMRGQGPQFLTKCNRYGTPYYCVAFALCFGLLSYMNVSNSAANVFNWFVNITTVSGYIAWIVVLLSYLRFRQAIIFNGLEDQLTYKARFQPYLTWGVIVFLIILAITNGYAVFFSFNAADFFAAYITIPIFALLYVGHLLWRKFTFPDQPLIFVKPIHSVDVITGKAFADAQEAKYPPRIPRNVLERIWFWIA